MGSAIAAVCALGCIAMAVYGVRAKAKRAADKRRRGGDEPDVEASAEDIAQWETEWADWRSAP